MPKRHRNTNFNHKTTGYTQRSCALSPSHSVRRALPALPGPIPQVEEAALFQGVTQASAEPLIGAIPSGPLNHSKTEGLSPSPMESDFGNSRLGGMGRLSDGYSHPTSDSNTIPLHTNNLESPPLSAPSPSGDTPIKRPLTLANSGTDPTTNGYGLSDVKLDERQEGAKEHTTNSDTINPPFIDSSLLIANNVSHPNYNIDKTYNIQTFSVMSFDLTGKSFFCFVSLAQG